MSKTMIVKNDSKLQGLLAELRNGMGVNDFDVFAQWDRTILDQIYCYATLRGTSGERHGWDHVCRYVNP